MSEIRRDIYSRSMLRAVKECDDSKRRATFVFSDDSVDRYGDTISAAGWHWETYNGVALFGHSSWNVQSVIGKTVDLFVEMNKLVGTIEFHPAGMCPTSDEVWSKLCWGSLNSVSVGFRPLKYARSKDPERPNGIDFLEQELMEISVVPVPANPNARQRSFLLERLAPEVVAASPLDAVEVERVVRESIPTLDPVAQRKQVVAGLKSVFRRK